MHTVSVSSKLKHYYLLLFIIYLGYISLGLPDTVLGVAWPVMRYDLHKSVEWAGILGMIIILGSSVSGFSSGFFINRIPAGVLLMVSCFMTGVSLLGFGLAPAFWVILFLAIPLGLGGGCIDAAMNSFIARHYSSRHMNWLHGCWGVGATIGPVIMTSIIAAGHGWRGGYGTISAIQLTLGVIFLFTLKLWTDSHNQPVSSGQHEFKVKTPETGPIYSDLSAWFSVLTFFCYCGAEYGFGLWGATFLINCRSFTTETAGYAVAIYWGSLTFGRFLCGWIADRIGNRKMVYGGITVAVAGQILLFLAGTNVYIIYPALLLMGMGLAPIYPCMMHETARRFSEKRANVVIGFQSGSACLGVAVLPFLTGLVGKFTGFALLPFILIGLLAILLMLNVLLNRRT